MSDHLPRIGDTVAWCDVPDGAMIAHGREIILRCGEFGWCVHYQGQDVWVAFGRHSDGDEGMLWRWPESCRQSVTILALNVPRTTPASELKELAAHHHAVLLH